MNVMDFKYISKLLYDRSGIVVGEDKAYLLESRLNPVARKWSLKGFDSLSEALQKSPNEAMINDVVEAMTTNESFFFRDQTPFKLFEELVLPTLLESRAATRKIRVWCAACSSGQEPYSLAIILSEMAAKLAGWNIEIVGSDLSTEISQKAKEGIYTQFEVQRGLPINLLVKYFDKMDDKWQIKPELRRMVSFRPFNLLKPMTALGRFDVVFCRNVLIYFDQDTKRQVLQSISQVMPPDGMLFLGGAETVLGVSESFQPVPGQRGIYGLTGSVGDGQQRGAA